MKDELDSTLPPELQGVVSYEQAKAKTEGERIMPDALTPEQVKAIAADLLKQKDAEQAIATKIEGLNLEVTNSKALLAEAVAAAASSKTSADTANAKLVTLTAELATATAKITELSTTNAGLQVTINKSQAAVASDARIKALKDAGIHTDARATKFTAVTAEGKLVISDEAFTADVAELQSAFAAGKASVPTPAPATPASTPTPAAAATPVTSAATTTSETPATATVATPTATPASPDLTDAGQYSQATAALLAGNMKPTEEGRSKFTAIGGIE